MFHSDKEFITDLFNARPFMKDRPIESNGTDLCNRCSNAVHQLLINFVTSIDELRKSSVQCELCRLLLKVIVERLSTETTTEPLSIQRKGSKITIQRGSHNCRLITIKRFPGKEALNVHIIGLRRLTSGLKAQKPTSARLPMTLKW